MLVLLSLTFFILTILLGSGVIGAKGEVSSVLYAYASLSVGIFFFTLLLMQ